MPFATHPALAEAIRSAARPLTGADSDFDPLITRTGNARFVLLGEASHGTQEFYRERARITRRLIEEKGFTAVAAEADWPDAWRVNRYVQGRGSDTSAPQALGGFRRFPSWMRSLRISAAAGNPSGSSSGRTIPTSAMHA
jgi:erythromycin esterase-like protein